LKKAPAQANRSHCSGTALDSNYASFDRSSIVHYDYEGNQPSIWEIRKFQLATCLVKDKMVWQGDVFEMRTK